MPRFALQIDLKKNKLMHCSGYPDKEPEEVGSQVRARLQRELGQRTFFVRGTFLGMDGAGELSRHLEAFTDELDAPGWAARLRGDFSVVVWDRAAGLITAISDRVGAHRLMVHRAPGGLVTITNRLMSQIRLQPAPRLDDLGVYSLLTMQYPMDPHTLLADTRALTIGDIARISAHGMKLLSYHEPVLEVVQNYASIEECVAELDRTLEQALSEYLVDEAPPIVMLSGGIDSVVMLDYLSRLAPGKVQSVTFATEGQKGDEMEPARIAAEHYGSTHHEHFVPRAEIDRLTREALVESDTTNYGGFLRTGIAEWFAARGPLTVFRGEDSRLPTPTFDVPALVGILAHRAGLHRSALGRRLWDARWLATAWPFRKGRNYLRYVLNRTDLTDGMRSYLLKNALRFNGPPDQPMPPELEQRFAHLGSWSSLEQTYRAVVALTLDVQHTENMHTCHETHEVGGSTVVVPYFIPEVLRAFNRVPYWMAARPTFAPGKTSSPIPVAAKYVLRKLMEGHAPEELLYRRKAVAPAEDVLYAESGARTIFPVIRDWSPTLLDQLEGHAGPIARRAVRQVLDGGLDPAEPVRLGLSSCLFHLSTLARLCADPSMDPLAEIDALAPWSPRP